MSVSLGKLQGVESVTVLLNDGKAMVRLKAGNAVTLEQVHQGVEKNGFTPQQATVTVSGQVAIVAGAPQIKLPGSNATYELTGTPSMQDALKGQSGKTVVVEGVIPAPKNKKAVHVIHVRTFTPAG